MAVQALSEQILEDEMFVRGRLVSAPLKKLQTLKAELKDGV